MYPNKYNHPDIKLGYMYNIINYLYILTIQRYIYIYFGTLGLSAQTKKVHHPPKKNNTKNERLEDAGDTSLERPLSIRGQGAVVVQ